MSIVDDVREGKIRPEDAIHNLALDLGEVESELELATQKLNRDRQLLRDQIATILAISGKDKIDIQGFGSALITKPSVTYKYDAKKLNKLVIVLITRGEQDLADDIRACREESGRAGYLMIRKDKR